MRRAARSLAIGALCALCASALSLGVNFAVCGVYSALGLEVPVPPWIGDLLRPEATSSGSVARMAGFAFGVALGAPVLEEFLFRGLLQGFLERQVGRTSVAVALTAVAFALVHMSVFSFLPLVAVSVCFSAARIKGGGLVAPMIAHSLYNALAVAVTIATWPPAS